MADESVKFKFDLDAKEALVKLTELHEGLLKVGESKNLEGLIGGFMKFAPQIAIATGAVLLFKEAFDLTLEGEAIEKVNKQFDMLASQAGISSTAIREGLEKSLGGMVDFEDALQASNQAIIKLGKSAERIPELFELSRKVTNLFGGDAIQNFDAISQAVAVGNTRILRNMGIIIDADKAYKNYAQSIGTTASSLSQAEKQSALINATLEFGKTKLSNITTESDTVTASIQRFKISIKDLTDGLATFIQKTGIVKGAIDIVGATAKSFGSILKENFGSELDKVSSQEERLNGELKEMQKYLENAKKGNEGFWSKLFGGPDVELIQKRIDDIKSKLSTVTEEKKKLEAEAPKPEVETKTTKVVDEEALRLRKEQRTRFERELLQIKSSRIKEDLAIETDSIQYQQLLTDQRLTIEQQYQAKIDELNQKGRESKEITQSQANLMIEQLEMEKNSKLIQFDRDREQAAIQGYENQMKAAQNASDGIRAAFLKNGLQAQNDLHNFGKTGQVVFSAVQGGASRFFKSLGEGSKDAGGLMREFMFGAIAEIAEAQGNMLLASGIGTMNPVQIAEGGALLALAGMLRSQAGGGGGGGASVAGGGGGGGAVPTSPEAIKPIAEQTPKKTVTVNFLGDYLETEQTQKRLVEMIRRETDATDYKYQQIPLR